MTSLPRISGSQLTAYRKLLQKKYRRSEGRFLIEGTLVVEEALASDWTCEAFCCSDEFLSKEEFVRISKLAKTRRIPIYRVSSRELQRLSDTVSSQGIVGIVNRKIEHLEGLVESRSGRSLVVALDGVADPGNLGSIVRTCDWFGVDAVLVSEDSVDLYNPKVVRATMGSLFHVPILAGVDLGTMLQKCAREGFTIVAAGVRGQSIFEYAAEPERVVIVFGSESHGISDAVQRHASVTVTVPRFGHAESLNVALSCAAILTALRFRRQ